MGGEFLDVFMKDKDAVYTACVAVILYDVIMDCKVIVGKKTVLKDTCKRHNEFKIPDIYDSPSAGTTEHCFCLKYINTYFKYNLFKEGSWEKKWVDKMCKIAIKVNPIPPDIIVEELKTKKQDCNIEKSIENIKLQESIKGHPFSS
jgi:hypothetical protein